MGIGERLKEERESKNMSLDDVQNLTKIQVRYLDAIEQERFNVMPGSFYVRAFIKEYATVLGLNPDELMEEYKSDLPFEKEESVALSRVNSSKKNKPTTSTPKIFSLLPSVIVVLLIIGIVVLVWLFRQGYFAGEEGDPTPADNDDNAAGESVQLPPSQDTAPSEEEEMEDGESADEEQVEEDEPEEPEQETEISLVNYENNESYYNLTTTEENVNLVITTENRNWLEIEDESGERFYYDTLTNEKGPLEIDVSDTEELYFTFGEPQYISIEVNDVRLELSDKIPASQPQKLWITIEKQ
ncbi:helix-turn-helix domain-containing protein [Gracilibacillus suaedae]|uniref:helix-turn-helix domain-containing protein n=1 Tax=Gracilibacillus suaedae TaxID=2820273 RepID=UPI001ABDFBB8|nr:helix-turn-helix domain-containing protein [Gracilibacillus suaedae]